MNDRLALRQHLKHVRLAISAQAQADATAKTSARIMSLARFRRATRIAGYFGSKGELDPTPLLEQAAISGKQCYLPILHPTRRGQLLFCRWQPGERLVLNQFGILEPIASADRLIAARNLDFVIVPLLGFDIDCNRIGMGGGYYDRSFAFRHRLKHINRPYMLGLAHETQRVERLNPQSWDVALDAVVTEQNFFCRKQKS